MEHLRATAARLEMPMAKLGLAWVLSRTGTTTVLVGARNIEQVDQAFEADELARAAELQVEFAAL
jgi:aryl-alcohol dehydrogenase-like predicted oxidoreductase